MLFLKSSAQTLFWNFYVSARKLGRVWSASWILDLNARKAGIDTFSGIHQMQSVKSEIEGRKSCVSRSQEKDDVM